MRKMFSKLILASVLTMAFVGCASKNEAVKVSFEKTTDEETGREMIGNMFVTGLPVVKEPHTFSVLMSRSVNDYSASHDEKHILPILTENTNVIFDIEDVTTNMNEKLNLLFAAGSGLPDIIWAQPSDSTLVNNTTFLFEFTEEILREYAPNLTSQIEENIPEGLDALKKADGKIYSLPTGVYAEYANSATAVPLIRTDWLEKVGMEMPTTTDELYEVLKAFKTQDPNGNGKDDEIPLAFCQANWASKQFAFAGPWGIAGRNINDAEHYCLVQDGVVVPTLDTQAFKDYLLFLNKLAKEELLDVEGFSLTNAQYQARLDENVVGMQSTWAEDAEIWAPVPILEAPGYEGKGVKQGQNGLRTANMNGFVLTTSCEDPLAALRAWDYLHSTPELKRISRDGNAGQLWIDNGDGTATVSSPETLPDGMTSDVDLNYTIAFRGLGALMFGDDTAKPDMNAAEINDDVLRYQYVDFYKDYFLDEFLPIRPVSSDKLTEKTFLQTELEAYINGFIAQSVLNGLTEEQWEEHLKQLEAVQYDAWIAWNQDYLDGKF
ncbi:MAG: hypothetical protein ATN31_09505 [Candidatus Epulonipiscioides saccharophilum]|nr:MAG: hypothetical protein ATN31_09505 [Epulopiscium sp. AS2M-Bin001]